MDIVFAAVGSILIAVAISMLAASKVAIAAGADRVIAVLHLDAAVDPALATRTAGVHRPDVFLASIGAIVIAGQETRQAIREIAE